MERDKHVRPDASWTLQDRYGGDVHVFRHTYTPMRFLRSATTSRRQGLLDYTRWQGGHTSPGLQDAAGGVEDESVGIS